MEKTIKSDILNTWLKNIPFDGVNNESLCASAQQLGYDAALIEALFPHKTSQALRDLSAEFDQKMLKKLETIDVVPVAIRERIKTATLTRLDLISDHKEAYRKIMGYWANPVRSLQGKKILWKTADTIWTWAGDQSTDYNYYTKRGLLSGVLGTTYLFWIQDKSADLEKTGDFLARRIENVIKLGQFVHNTKTRVNIHK